MSRTRRMTTAHRVAAVVVGVLLALPLAAAAALATAAPAQASTYRYWTYWWGTDSGKPHTGWQFAPQGPASHRVSDGWVLGWRFETTTTSGKAAPRTSASFATLCPDLAPVAGQVRVALVIDYGTSSDAPPGQHPPTTSTVRLECFTLPASPSPSGLTVLQQAPHGQVVVRAENGLICALDGYPVGECAPVVADPTASPSATRKPTPSSSPTRPTSVAPVPSRSATATEPSGDASTTATGGTEPPPVSTPLASGLSATATAPTGEAAGIQPDPTLPAVAGAPVPASSEQSGSPLGLGIGAVLVLVIGGSAYWTSRRGGGAS